MLRVVTVFIILLVTQPFSIAIADKGLVKVKKGKSESVIVNKSTPRKVKQEAEKDSIKVKKDEPEASNQPNQPDKGSVRANVKDDKPESVIFRNSTPHEVIRNNEALGSILRFKLNRDKSGENGRAVFWLSFRTKTGNPIKNLRKEDFKIVESVNGSLRVVPISEISIESQPIASALILDVSTSVGASGWAHSRRALGKYVNQMNQGDVSEIIFFGSDVSVVKSFTENKFLLKAVLALPLVGGGTALYDAIVYAHRELQRLDDDKYLKALLVFTDGKDTSSSRTLEDVVDVVSSSSIPIFTIGVGDADAGVLQKIAGASNGLYFSASDTATLESIYDSIAKIVREAYVVSYPTSAKSGEKVDVEISASFKDHKRNVGKFFGQYSVP